MSHDPNEVLVCRTIGSHLQMRRCEFGALLADLRCRPRTIQRRIEVLLGEKSLNEVDADEQRERAAEPAYTVVGTHGEGGAPYTITVYTHDGPEAALTLAHEAYAEQCSAHAGEGDGPELQVVAVFADQAKLIDFDRRCTWPGEPQERLREQLREIMGDYPTREPLIDFLLGGFDEVS